MRELTYSQPSERRQKKAPGPVARQRARRRRAEDKVERIVRAMCVDRDGYCRIGCVEALYAGCTDRDDELTDSPCSGPIEWAHIETRARTRNMKPELRHNTATSVMLCRKHHAQLDGRARPRIRVEVQTGVGADGPLTWRTA